MAKKIGVILSGCGFKDGAEIHESVLTILALDRAGAEVVYMAPDVDQTQVVNHINDEKLSETRNVLVESSRIARGDISDIANVKADDLDGLVLPGGFGAALNLSDFGMKGAEASVNRDVKRLLVDCHAQRKPIGAICIAPAVIATALGNKGVKLTIGNDEETASGIQAHGANHENCAVESICIDVDNKIVSTPAYMLGPNIRHVAAGIELLVAEVMRMA
jgi:enhancing lycopene biosynthesis protein 2